MSEQTASPNPEKKTRKPRTPKQVNPHIASLKKITKAAEIIAKASELLSEEEFAKALELARPAVVI